MKRPNIDDFSGITYSDKWGDYADALDEYANYLEFQIGELRDKKDAKFLNYQNAALEKINELKAKSESKFNKCRSWLEWAFNQIDADQVEDYDTYDKLNEYVLNF